MANYDEIEAGLHSVSRIEERNLSVFIFTCYLIIANQVVSGCFMQLNYGFEPLEAANDYVKESWRSCLGWWEDLVKNRLVPTSKFVETEEFDEYVVEEPMSSVLSDQTSAYHSAAEWGGAIKFPPAFAFVLVSMLVPIVLTICLLLYLIIRKWHSKRNLKANLTSPKGRRKGRKVETKNESSINSKQVDSMKTPKIDEKCESSLIDGEIPNSNPSTASNHLHQDSSNNTPSSLFTKDSNLKKQRESKRAVGESLIRPSAPLPPAFCGEPSDLYSACAADENEMNAPSGSFEWKDWRLKAEKGWEEREDSNKLHWIPVEVIEQHSYDCAVDPILYQLNGEASEEKSGEGKKYDFKTSTQNEVSSKSIPSSSATVEAKTKSSSKKRRIFLLPPERDSLIAPKVNTSPTNHIAFDAASFAPKNTYPQILASFSRSIAKETRGEDSRRQSLSATSEDSNTAPTESHSSASMDIDWVTFARTDSTKSARGPFEYPGDENDLDDAQYEEDADDEEEDDMLNDSWTSAEDSESSESDSAEGMTSINPTLRPFPAASVMLCKDDKGLKRAENHELADKSSQEDEDSIKDDESDDASEKETSEPDLSLIDEDAEDGEQSEEDMDEEDMEDGRTDEAKSSSSQEQKGIRALKSAMSRAQNSDGT